MSKRQKRLESLIQKEISEIMIKDISDPGLGFFTVRTVKISGDLKNAKIALSFMGNEKEKSVSFEVIKSHQPYIRHKLAGKLSIRFVPEIEFVLDDGKEFRIEEILAEDRRARDEKHQTEDI